MIPCNVRRFAARVALLSLLAFLLPAATRAASVPPTRSFDEGWGELLKLEQAPMPAGSGRTEMMLALTERTRQRIRLAWELFEEHPQDPRRWDAAVKLIRTVSGYIHEITGDPEKDGPGAFKRDAVAQTAWHAYARAIYEQMLATPDLSAEMQVAAIDAWIYRLNMTPSAKLEEQRAAMDEFLRRFPDEPKAASYEQRYYERLQRANPAAATEHLQAMLRSPNAAVREKAEGMSRIDLGRQIDLKFTALDGREVDLAQMRGKVVLVDFWATWCGPCIAEIPAIKAVHEKYRAQGFEVVGISLDGERDRQKLADFVRERDLPWPQHFDGKGWRNEFAQKFSISAIPAMFLIDKEGRVASNNARGHQLEAEVRRLLGL